MADPRKLDHKDPKNTKKETGIERKNFKPEDSRKNLKGIEGRGASIAKTKTVGPKVLKENLLAALEKSLGIVATACRAVNCSRDMHYYLMKNDEDYATRYAEISNIALDFVESQLFQKIKERDTACIIFYLKTKGRVRGYIEKVETEHTVKPAYDLSKLTDEELIVFTNIQMKLDGSSYAEIVK